MSCKKKHCEEFDCNCNKCWQQIAQGDPGKKGKKGHTGPRGDTGRDGNTGSAGTKGDTGNAGAKGDTGSNGVARSSLPLNFTYTQPNGNGFQISSNQWTIAGYFAYGGLTDPILTTALVIGYTTNTGSWYRFRVRDTSNNTIFALSPPDNTFIFPSPNIISLVVTPYLPATRNLCVIEMLATDSTGNVGISGRQAIGINTLQLYA